MLTKLMNVFSAIINIIFSFLPDSPFTDFFVPEYVRTILGYANYFLPINEIITTLGLWVAAIAIYYVYSALLRILKTID